MEIQWHLSEPDFFQGLDREKALFLAAATPLTYHKNEFIFLEGEAGDAAYYIEAGSVSIFRATAAGKEPVFFLRHAGELFGLAEVLGGRARKCHAQAIAPTRLHRIGQADFDRLLAEHFPLARRTIEVLGRRLRYLGEQIENLVTCDVVERLLKLLVYLTYPQLVEADDLTRPAAVPVRLTQEQLAAMTGTCQQTVSESLKELQAAGLVACARREIILSRPLEALRRLGLAE